MCPEKIDRSGREMKRSRDSNGDMKEKQEEQEEDNVKKRIREVSRKLTAKT